MSCCLIWLHRTVCSTFTPTSLHPVSFFFFTADLQLYTVILYNFKTSFFVAILQNVVVFPHLLYWLMFFFHIIFPISAYTYLFGIQQHLLYKSGLKKKKKNLYKTSTSLNKKRLLYVKMLYTTCSRLCIKMIQVTSIIGTRLSEFFWNKAM